MSQVKLPEYVKEIVPLPDGSANVIVDGMLLAKKLFKDMNMNIPIEIVKLYATPEYLYIYGRLTNIPQNDFVVGAEIKFTIKMAKVYEEATKDGVIKDIKFKNEGDNVLFIVTYGVTTQQQPVKEEPGW